MLATMTVSRRIVLRADVNSRLCLLMHPFPHCYEFPTVLARPATDDHLEKQRWVKSIPVLLFRVLA
jgi:hypothetical protein